MTSSTFRATCLLTVALLLALAATPSFSSNFVGTGAGLACGGVGGGPSDPNYTLTMAPFPGPYDARTTAPNLPGWVVPPSGSATCWINPYGDGTVVAPSGDYHYQITFNWSGNISAEFAADNDAEIWLNGVDTGIGTLNGVFGFKQLTPFTITDLTPGWHSGSNTLDFVVNNWVEIPLATGLLVVPTPEPSSLVIFGSGVLALVGLLRRKINL